MTISKIDWLWRSERRLPALLLVSLVISIVYVLATFPADFLEGTGTFWASPRGYWLRPPSEPLPNTDMIAVIAGYIAFVHQPWSFPLLYVPGFGAPAGTNLVFLAAAPIVALLGKIASLLAGHLVIPYGAWTGVCFVLSGLFATLCVAEWGQRNILAAVAATILAISATPLLFRFGHISLMGQWLILGALWLYLRDRRSLSRSFSTPVRGPPGSASR